MADLVESARLTAAVTEGVRQAFAEMGKNPLLPAWFTNDGFYEAVREGVADGIWRVAKAGLIPALTSPGSQFFAAIREGVAEAMTNMAEKQQIPIVSAGGPTPSATPP